MPRTNMRRIGALALLVIGALALLAGIGMRTWWLPPATLSATVPDQADPAPVTVIDHRVADLGRGKDVTVSIKAEGPFVLAQGRATDVDAWVGRAAHTTVTGQGDELAATTTPGESRVPNPDGADLFVSTQRASGELTHEWTGPEDGDWSLLLTADGTAAAPTDVTVTWDNDQSTPWSVPLIVLGAIALIAGLALIVLRRRDGSARPSGGQPGGSGTPGHGRRAAGSSAVTGTDQTPATVPAPTGTYRPDYGSRGSAGAPGVPGRAEGGQAQPRSTTTPSTSSSSSHGGRLRAAVSGGLGGLLVVGALTAVPLAAAAPVGAAVSRADSPSPSSSASAPAAPTAADIALQPQQVDRIMGAVASVVGKADTTRSAAALRPRMDGEALAERSANYRIRATAPTYRAPATIAAGPVLAQMITTGAAWPRTVVMVTKDDDSTVPQILTLTQASARENYRVVSAVGLLPGTTFPQAGSDEPGVRPLDPARSDGLTTSPAKALSALASVLTAGRTAPTGAVAKNRFVDEIIAGQADAVKANTDARISNRHTPDPAQTRVLQASDGGALVIGTLRNTVAVAPKDKGGRLTLRSELAALAGARESNRPVEIGYGESVVLYVPAAGSREAVQVIGAAQELVSVTRR